MSTPANPRYMRLSWLIERLQANVVPGRDPLVSFNTIDGDAGQVLSFYPSPDLEELCIDLGREGE